MDHAVDGTRGGVSQTSCDRCRKRKVKCDRQHPCSRCQKDSAECIFIGTGERQRPVPRSHVQALEGQIASLEQFIGKLQIAEPSQRDEMLAGFRPTAQPDSVQEPPQPVPSSSSAQEDADPMSNRSRSGQLRKLGNGKSSQFYGATSLFQIYASDDDSMAIAAPQNQVGAMTADLGQESIAYDMQSLGMHGSYFIYPPTSEVCLELVGTFFREQYQYFMCVYREYFLRDLDRGGGPYYSDTLLYAICSFGALACEDPWLRQQSAKFSSHAQALLYASLEQPNLTTLQALLLLGHREIGHGKASKGWLFCGMAFRLAVEMGLHLDPENWKFSSESLVDREISRRVYWVAFVSDKQLCLYFGRPPAFHPRESDVRNTIRIPYPKEWQSLLEKYIVPGVSENAYEDGIALVACFIHKTELCKIIHRMITEIFENRHFKTDGAVLMTTAQDIHVSLTKWLTGLPGKLHWNQWTVGQVPGYVLHLHMLFHTVMIILHRPPVHLFKVLDSSTNEDVAICYESLQAILRLLRTYSRYYKYTSLPLSFVHTLSSAASVVLMKRYFEGSSWEDADISKPLEFILDVMETIKYTWPSIEEVRESIYGSMRNQTRSGHSVRDRTGGLSYMAGLSTSTYSSPDAVQDFEQDMAMDDVDLGLLMPDAFENDRLAWGDLSLG